MQGKVEVPSAIDCSWPRFMSPEDAFDYVKKKHPIQGYLEGKKTDHMFIANLIRRFLPEGGRILDIGCGGMNKTGMMSLLGYNMHAADDFQDPWHICGNNLDMLKGFAKELRITLTLQSKDNYGLDYPEGYFDGCMINDVIEHLHESPRSLLNNCGYWVREGGFLFVTMPNSVNLRKRISVMMGRSNYPPVGELYNCERAWRGHVREYTLAEQEYILRENGFKVCFSTTFHGMIDERLSSGLSRGLFKTICVLMPSLRERLATVAQKPVGWTPTQTISEF